MYEKTGLVRLRIRWPTTKRNSHLIRRWLGQPRMSINEGSLVIGSCSSSQRERLPHSYCYHPVQRCCWVCMNSSRYMSRPHDNEINGHDIKYSFTGARKLNRYGLIKSNRLSRTRHPLWCKITQLGVEWWLPSSSWNEGPPSNRQSPKTSKDNPGCHSKSENNVTWVEIITYQKTS